MAGKTRTFAVALVLGWGTVVGATGLVLGALASGLVYNRAMWKVAFNSAQYTISIIAAGVVFRSLSLASVIGQGPFPPRDLPFALLCGMIFFLANKTLVACAIALSQRRPIAEVNRESFGLQATLSAGLVALSPAVVVLVDWSNLDPSRADASSVHDVCRRPSGDREKAE